MSFSSNPLTPRIASEIVADKATLLSGKYATEIRALLEERGVLVFPQINFTDEEQVAFTKTLGTFAPESRDPNDAGESVAKISLDPNNSVASEYLKGSLYWHIDGTMNKVPILASLLSAKVLAPEGGDTEFCNTYAAYDDLSDEDKAYYETLSAVHSIWSSCLYYDTEPAYEKIAAMMSMGENELPLVWRHVSGRKSLVLGCTARRVTGLSDLESTKLLIKLRDWATKPQFVYCHKWTVGDLVMWDNTGTMHRATPYDPFSGRMMHRTKLQGEESFEAVRADAAIAAE